MRTIDGTVVPSGLNFNANDYGHMNVTYPVLGVVLNVFKSNDPHNTSSSNSRDGFGSHAQARVLVVNDGSDSPWIIDNVTITPSGSTGFDNYEEELPRGTTGTIDDAETEKETNPNRYNGDWCVVDFIGGNIASPFMVTWWPHPSNKTDAAIVTEGRRFAKRFQGTRFVATSKGSILIDTQEANRPKTSNNTRKPEAVGGDIRVSMKPEREFEVNFNPFVKGDPNEPEFLWGPNEQPQSRQTSNTSLKLTQTSIAACAGEEVNLTAQRGNVNVSTPEGDIKLGMDADQHAVLGDLLNTFLDKLITNIMQITVATPLGPSSVPLNSPIFASMKIELQNHLSQFVFIKKDKA